MRTQEPPQPSLNGAPISADTQPQTDDAAGMVRSAQAVRLQRLLMATVSYSVTAVLVLFCSSQDMVPLAVAIQFGCFVLGINTVFLLLIKTNLNLRFRDPSMTAVQMVVSLLPALWVMYFLDAGQARATFLLIAMVPALYGILALNIRQFLLVAFLFFALYGVLTGVLWWTRPEVMNGSLEIFQLLALLLVMGEIAVIGGFIHSLRERLRSRNLELKHTMHELQGAMAKISDMARRDALTGLFNRRHLFDVLAEEANRQRRATGPFSVCILDVDYFKQVNDRHGHQAGDAVLKSIADNVGQSLRNIDCFGRYGGEEFLIVLPQTDIGGAMIKAERVRSTIELQRFPDIGESFRVTVSIGVAEHRPEESPEGTVNRADEALYRAKNGGRNRVVAASTADASLPAD